MWLMHKPKMKPKRFMQKVEANIHISNTVAGKIEFASTADRVYIVKLAEVF
jgi:hypothetical protein